MARFYDDSLGVAAQQNAILWRYMDVAKFIAMVVDSALFFSRADRLGDPFEGSLPGPEARAHRLRLASLVGLRRANAMAEPSRYEWSRTWIYVSCWHMNPYESAAMWKLYAQSGDALAVRVRMSALIAQLPDSFFLAGVRYINYKHESIAFDDPYLSPILYKRKSFEHEREVRAFRFDGPVSALANNGGVMIERSKRNDLSGKSIQVSIGDLIEDIVVSPTAPPWLTIVLSKMLEKYSLSTKIRRSSLLDVPAF